MVGNNNSGGIGGGDGVESGVYSCNWTLGGEQEGHEFPVLSAGMHLFCMVLSLHFCVPRFWILSIYSVCLSACYGSITTVLLFFVPL